MSAGADVKGQDGTTTIWATTKYPLISSTIPIAKYAEAQLIIAEVDLGQSAVGIINNLRSRAGLTAASNVSGTTAAEILALVIDERRRELFLEGQRLYDIIRFRPSTVSGGGRALHLGRRERRHVRNASLLPIARRGTGE